MITSVDNKKIKDVCRLAVKKKERLSRGLFIAEGEKLVAEAPRDRVESIFCTEAFAKAHPEILIPEITKTVSEQVFAKMSDTDTPQGVLAVVRMQQNDCKVKYSLLDLLSRDDVAYKPQPVMDDVENSGTFGGDVGNSDTLKNEAENSPASGGCEAGKRRAADDKTKNLPLILFLEDIRDPGNLGTIIRSAEAAGVTGVVMSKDTVDIYSPKTVRSTMGSIYRVPFFYADDFRAELEHAKKSGIRLYAAYLDSSVSYYEADFTGSCGILIGNEAAGLSKEAAALADERMIIPMQGKVESLNAAMAASIIIFEARRQRNQAC